jgi:hypothetical protein
MMHAAVTHLLAFSAGGVVIFFVAVAVFAKMAAWTKTSEEEEETPEPTESLPKKWIQFPLILRPEFLKEFCERHGYDENGDLYKTLDGWQDRVDQASLLGRNTTPMGFSFVRRVVTKEQWAEIEMEMEVTGFRIGEQVPNNPQYEYVRWI